jgi:hypothetical protein
VSVQTGCAEIREETEMSRESERKGREKIEELKRKIQAA